MTPSIIAQFVICGICLAIGLLHLAIYSRLPDRRAEFFGASFFALGGYFWDKARALFIHSAKAKINANS